MARLGSIDYLRILSKSRVDLYVWAPDFRGGGGGEDKVGEEVHGQTRSENKGGRVFVLGLRDAFDRKELGATEGDCV